MLNRHLLAYLPVYAAQALVGFGSVIVFTRLLSPNEYGQYMLVMAGAALLATGVFTWLDAAVARHHARADARGHLAGHLFTAWRLYALIAAPATLVAATAIALLPLSPALQAACAFALANVVIRSALSIALETRRAAGEAWRYSALETFTLAAGFGFGVGFAVFTDLGAAGPFAGLALAALITLVIDAPILITRSRRDRADGVRAAAFFAYGGPVAFSLIFEHLLSVGDRFVIAAFLGEAATGAYAAGYAIADRTISIVFLWLGSTTGPLLIAALEHRGRAAAQGVARDTAALMGLIGFPAAAGMALIAGPAAAWLIDAELSQASASVIPFIAVSGLMNGIMTFYFHEAYVLGRQPRAMAVIMTAAAIANLILNLILTPRFGLVGAALSTVLAYAGALLVCVVHGRRVFALPIPVGEWSKAALATAVMALVLITAPAPEAPVARLAVLIPLGALSYGAMALALNTAKCRDWVRIGMVRRLLKGAGA